MAFLKFICHCAIISYLVKQHNLMIILLSLKFFLCFNTYFNRNVIISICFNESVSCLSIICTVKFVIYCTTHYHWLNSRTLVTLSWITRNPCQVELSPFSLDLTDPICQSFIRISLSNSNNWNSLLSRTKFHFP